MCNSELYYMGMLYLHNDILPTGVAQRSEVDVFSCVCLLVSLSVCLFANTIISERLNVRR